MLACFLTTLGYCTFIQMQKLSKKYEKEIDLLKQELTMQDILHRKGSSSLSYDPLNEAQINDIHRQVRGYVEGTLPELKVGFKIPSLSICIHAFICLFFFFFRC